MSLQISLERSNEFRDWLHERMNNTQLTGLRDRERSSLSIFQHTLDIVDAISVLIEAGLPGPSLVLARPLFEEYVRGFWLQHAASDVEVGKFLQGSCPLFRDLLPAIPNDAESGGAWIHNNKNANWKSFNDLTHGGSTHVERRNTADAIEPNYSESELESLVEFGIEVRMRIGVAFFALINDEAEIEDLNKKVTCLRSNP